MKKGRFSSSGVGFQPGVVNWRCKDRINCDYCGNHFVIKQGKLEAVEKAIYSGAHVYVVSPEDWDRVKKYAARNKLDGSYIRISYSGLIYVLIPFLDHEAARQIDYPLDFYKIIRNSDGRISFIGDYSISKEKKARQKKDFKFVSYLPIFADRTTEEIIAPTKLPKSIQSRVYINPIFGIITSKNVVDYMKWRAEAIASIVSLEKPEYKIVGFYEEDHWTNKDALDAGEVITNRVVESKLYGPEIKDDVIRMIDAIQFGDTPPLFNIDNYSIIKGPWEYINGMVVLEEDLEKMYVAYTESQLESNGVDNLMSYNKYIAHVKSQRAHGVIRHE